MTKNKKICLAEETISQEELAQLCDWIQEGHRLTKGEKTTEFEQAFAKWQGSQYALFVNSGSSANLVMAYGLERTGLLGSKSVIAPAVSWITTVAPFLQLGFNVRLCDADPRNLGLNVDHLERLCEEEPPAIVILVHVLGHPNNMDKILELKEKYGFYLLEDACEALGSQWMQKKLGSVGDAGSFSFYYGHHISTIEGGMVVTDNFELYETMKSIRSHGWARDLSETTQNHLMNKYSISAFRNLYTFYHPGFNLRSTDLQAKIGLTQLNKIDTISKIREQNFYTYSKYLKDFYVQSSENNLLSSFAYGTLVENPDEVFRRLALNDIESRPLVCGSIARQPFFEDRYNVDYKDFSVSDQVHNKGIYLPNHARVSEGDIEKICKTFLEIARPI